MEIKVPDVVDVDSTCDGCLSADTPLHLHGWYCPTCKQVHRAPVCGECCADVTNWQMCELALRDLACFWQEAR